MIFKIVENLSSLGLNQKNISMIKACSYSREIAIHPSEARLEKLSMINFPVQIKSSKPGGHSEMKLSVIDGCSCNSK